MLILRSERTGTFKLPVMSTTQQDGEQVWQEELPTVLFKENIKNCCLMFGMLMYLFMLVYNFHNIFIIFKYGKRRFMG